MIDEIVQDCLGSENMHLILDLHLCNRLNFLRIKIYQILIVHLVLTTKIVYIFSS